MLNPKLLSEAFPVNKVEVFFDAEDHSNFLGFNWEMISQGKMPIGLNTSDTDFNLIGKTGGEKMHTLTVDEIPSHQHRMASYTGSGSTNDGYNAYVGNGVYRAGLYTNNTGGGEPHNNMPPYIVMAFWKRIA